MRKVRISVKRMGPKEYHGRLWIDGVMVQMPHIGETRSEARSAAKLNKGVYQMAATGVMDFSGLTPMPEPAGAIIY